ncbi:MAG: aminopeptidase N, partial [Deltaproteobacteria bacterium]|nr:aminopeptidase N [Deltaproteobacteria bacterium]
MYCRKSLKRFFDHEEVFEITRQGFAFYEDHFGQPYPFGKYDQLFVPEYNSGAMENVGCVTFNESQVFRDPPTDTQRLVRAEVVLHELAHMWFGNLVTMKWWDGLWLNESFATYISFLAMSEATRFQDGWENFLGTIKTWAYREDQKPTTHPISGVVKDTDETFLNFDGITYGKGAAVLKQLRAAIGGEAFRDGLRLYFDRHAWGNTTIEDFLAPLGEASGKDLDSWAASWLETSGVNVLRPEIGANGVELRQDPDAADARLRPHRVDVSLFTGDDALSATRTWALDIDGASTPLAGDVPGTSRLLWANHGDHAYARVFLDDASLACVQERLSDVDDPLVRMGLWGTLWEMLRDGAIPPAEFIALAARFLPRESKPEILETNLRLSGVALARYAAPAKRAALGSTLFEAACNALTATETGCDRQLIWGRAIPPFIASKSDATTFLGWLDDAAPGALPVDQGLRWRILQKASAFGLADVAARLDIESERDPSHRGKKARFAADTSWPDADRKRGLFERFADPDDSADLLKAGMAS